MCTPKLERDSKWLGINRSTIQKLITGQITPLEQTRSREAVNTRPRGLHRLHRGNGGHGRL